MVESNVFFKDNNGELHTPVPDSFLDGITRRTVIQIAKNNNFVVNEGHYKPEFLLDCEESFLTGTAVEITPVQSVDDYMFGEREITKKLITEFQKKVFS